MQKIKPKRNENVEVGDIDEEGEDQPFITETKSTENDSNLILHSPDTS